MITNRSKSVPMQANNPTGGSAEGGSFSYFVAPISQKKIALKSVTITEVYEYIVTDFFKRVTDRVRSGKGLKRKDLAYVTPSGCFTYRDKDHLLSYSGIIVIDLDNCDTSLKPLLAADPLLRPALIFTSPSNTGLKLLICVNGSAQENHLNCYNAICRYLFDTYNLYVDTSGSDIPRACFLCYDPEAIYNPVGSIESETLLSLLPPAALAAAAAPHQHISTSPHQHINASSRNLPPAPSSCNSSSIRSIRYEEKPSSRLNKMSEIHAMAVSALERTGWKFNGDLITRPGKELREGCSAIYNLYEKEGVWILTCFSSNAQPFKSHRGYSDVQILCLLDYNDDWTACISDLASQYLEPV